MPNSMRVKTIIVVLFSAFVAIIGIFFSARSNAEWGVLVIGLPSHISVKDAFQSTMYYILKQTHEPIFRKDDGQIYRSRILKRWIRNPKSSEYEFCPDTTLKFNDTIDFSLPIFLSHMERVTSVYNPLASVKKHGDCVQVKFPHSQKKYLNFLTYYENAPTIKRVDGIEDGLGKYFVDLISNEEIVLKRKEKFSSLYDKVVFYEYKGKKDPNLQNKNIKDFNNIPIFDVPDWASSEYFNFNTVSLKSINLIINHPDIEVRKAIYNCLNVTELRQAFFPLKKDFYNIKTVLPVGVLGAKSGAPLQQCDVYRHKATMPLEFANWNEDGRVSLTDFVDSVNNKTGMKIRVVNYSPKDLIKKIHLSPHPYNMIVIVLDAIKPDDTAFLSPFISKNGYYDFEIEGLLGRYKDIQKEEDVDKKTKLAAGFAKELVDQAIVLTLYQNIKTLYYPNEIKDFVVGRGFMQYPEVAEFRI